jgi:hypothetical protein
MRLRQAAMRQAKSRRCVAGDERVVVRGDDDGGAETVHLLEELHQTLGLGVVEVAGGFVSKEQAGTVDDGSGDGNALLLAAGQLGRAGVGLFGEANPAEHFAHIGADLALGAAGDAQWQRHVVKG